MNESVLVSSDERGARKRGLMPGHCFPGSNQEESVIEQEALWINESFHE